MSNCDVCIGTYDYDGPEFWQRSTPKARKPHRCCECHREIRREKPTSGTRAVGMETSAPTGRAPNVQRSGRCSPVAAGGSIAASGMTCMRYSRTSPDGRRVLG